MTDTTTSQNIKSEEELSRVYQTLSLPAIPREVANPNIRYIYLLTLMIHIQKDFSVAKDRICLFCYQFVYNVGTRCWPYSKINSDFAILYPIELMFILII